jgi:hypothetical protein
LEAEIARADAAEKVNAAAIEVIADDYLVGQDRTDLEGMINGKVDKTAYAEDKAALQQADSNNLAEAKTYAEGLVNALDHEDVGTGNFVSKVEQTDGKVKVTYGTLPVDTLVTGTTNGTVKFNNTEVAVAGLKSAAYTEASAYATAAQGAKADAAAPQATTYTKDEVDAMWAWAEIV